MMSDLENRRTFEERDANKNSPKCNEKEYSKYIYLCVKCDFTQSYNCMRFNSYKDADEHCNRFYDKSNHHILLPVCKYTPSFLHEYILNWKIQ